jgi:hypothetical protein
MSQQEERACTLVAWVMPANIMKKSTTQSVSLSHNSIIQNSRMRPQETTEEPMRQIVTVLEDRQNVLLFVEGAEDRSSTADREVTLEVDIAVTGAEG